MEDGEVEDLEHEVAVLEVKLHEKTFEESIYHGAIVGLLAGYYCHFGIALLIGFATFYISSRRANKI